MATSHNTGCHSAINETAIRRCSLLTKKKNWTIIWQVLPAILCVYQMWTVARRIWFLPSYVAWCTLVYDHLIWISFHPKQYMPNYTFRKVITNVKGALVYLSLHTHQLYLLQQNMYVLDYELQPRVWLCVLFNWKSPYWHYSTLLVLPESPHCEMTALQTRIRCPFHFNPARVYVITHVYCLYESGFIRGAVYISTWSLCEGYLSLFRSRARDSIRDESSSLNYQWFRSMVILATSTNQSKR